jgi:hypothetical protein
MTGFSTFAQVMAHAHQDGRDTVIDFGNGDSLTLQHVRMASLHAENFTFL